jgi:hypothetical protein
MDRNLETEIRGFHCAEDKHCGLLGYDSIIFEDEDSMFQNSGNHQPD